MKQAIFILSLLLAACSILGDDNNEKITADKLVLQTDSTAYTAQLGQDEERTTYRFTLIAFFTNKTNQAVYLNNQCWTQFSNWPKENPRPIYGVRLLGHESPEYSGYSPIYACPGDNDAIAVKAGAVRIDTFHVNGPNLWKHGTYEPIGVLEGRYRLLYDVQTCRKEVKCDLPDSLTWSNEFEVSLAK